MTRKRRPATPEEFKALAHPLRIRILRLCLNRSLTNRELASRLGRDPGTVLYHVRLLVSTGFLAPEPVRTGARGALERPYRSTGKSWALEMGDEPRGYLAAVDAFRAELHETRRGDVLTLVRMGLRLGSADLEELEVRLAGLVKDFEGRDASDGEALGLFIGLHRRREADASDEAS